jgi:hypothetical protein
MKDVCNKIKKNARAQRERVKDECEGFVYVVLLREQRMELFTKKRSKLLHNIKLWRKQ